MNYKQMSDSIRVSIMLSFIGGFLELYSYLLKGEVFATAITGNIVLMAYHINNGNLKSVPKYILPIIFFALGVLASEILRKYLKPKEFIHWRVYVILLELIVIIIIPLFKINVGAVSLISFVSALQIQSFKKIKDYTYMSTMNTGNFKNFIDNLFNKNYIKAKIYMYVILSFIVGIIIADIFIKYFRENSIYICIMPLLTVMYFMIRDK